jgi:plastocyanin
VRANAHAMRSGKSSPSVTRESIEDISMKHASRSFCFVTAIIASTLVSACGDDPVDMNVAIRDQCDSTTFNAGIGAGTCVTKGSVTLSAFNSELSSTHQVAAWMFEPSTFSIRVGQKIAAMNAGGEEHTFTEVQAFGGGIVPALNSASGNPTEAPECAALTTADHIKPGQTFTTDGATEVGTEHYQCCIHPWMRATVTVNQ